MTADRDQLRRDLEQFGYLAPTLGQHAPIEVPDDVLASSLVTTTIDAMPTLGNVRDALRARVVEALQTEPAAPLDERASAALEALFRDFQFIDVTRVHRRARIRRAARARKARRGWR